MGRLEIEFKVSWHVALLLAALAVGLVLWWSSCVTRVYAPVTITVCAEAEVNLIMTAKAAAELAAASDACLKQAKGDAQKKRDEPDAGPEQVKKHGRLYNWVVDEIEKRLHRDGGTR